MRELPTLVIGDVHGHFDRLTGLLEQEGIVKDGRRVNRDVRVVQLGDLGHFGRTGSPTGDQLCYEHADDWLDALLWGNHDRALVDQGHVFGGFQTPPWDASSAIRHLLGRRKLRLAAVEHGRLLTHAGVHPAFEDSLSKKPAEAAARIQDAVGTALVDAISNARGGRSPMGGLLWRDWREPISDRWPQVCGHTKDQTVRHEGQHWCVDVGSPNNGRLAAIWLPDERVVEYRATERIAA